MLGGVFDKLTPGIVNLSVFTVAFAFYLAALLLTRGQRERKEPRPWLIIGGLVGFTLFSLILHQGMDELFVNLKSAEDSTTFPTLLGFIM